MTAFQNKSFSVAVNPGTPKLRPGTRAWSLHVLCDGPSCPKCRPPKKR